MSSEEERLRGALRRAHADDSPPPFRLPGTASRSRSHRLRAVALVGIAVLAGVAVALGRLVRPTPPPAVQLAQWQAPLDFLLRTPGSDLLATAPRFGAEGMLP